MTSDFFLKNRKKLLHIFRRVLLSTHEQRAAAHNDGVNHEDQHLPQRAP